MNEIRLHPDENEWRFPALRIELTRAGHPAGHVYVRFPERVDARTATGDGLRLYKDNRSVEWPADLACEPAALPVSWYLTDRGAAFRLEFDNGLALEASATVTSRGVDFGYVLENGTSQDLHAIRVDICLQALYVPDVIDPGSERTAFPVSGIFRTVDELVPAFAETGTADAAGHRFYGYPAGPRRPVENPVITPHPGYPDDPDRAIYRWTTPSAIDRAAVAIASRDDTWCLAVVCDSCSRAWNNPALSCMHASPESEGCRKGESVRLTNTLVVHEGPLSSLARSIGERAW